MSTSHRRTRSPDSNYSSSSYNNNKRIRPSDYHNGSNNKAKQSQSSSQSQQQLERHLTFESMKLKPDLLRGIYSYGYEKPSKIQQIAITPILHKRDVIAQSQSGTGKTTIFSISILQLLNESLRQCQGLILSPTRELAIQTCQIIQQFSKYMSNIICISCVGGNTLSQDIKQIQSGVHIISGTPGRVYDLIQRQVINTKHIRIFVLDEADELLSQGFKTQIYDIYRFLSPTIQTVLISATLPPDIVSLSDKFMVDPIKILVKRDELTLDGIKQYFVNVSEEKYKFETLIDLYETMTITQCVIFCNTRNKVDLLSKELVNRNFTVSSMHGDMPQKERNEVMSSFRSGKTRVLITTDIWGRGIDVQQVSLVINYDIAYSREFYIHRIGRSGRFGRKGIAINLVTDSDIKQLREIAQFYHTQIDEMPINVAELIT